MDNIDNNFERYYDNMPFGMCILKKYNSSYNIIYRNVMFEEIFGYIDKTKISQIIYDMIIERFSDLSNLNETKNYINGDIYISFLKKYFGITVYKLPDDSISCLLRDRTDFLLFERAIRSTLYAYKELHFIRLDDNYYQMIYPDKNDNANRGDYTQAITSKILSGYIHNYNKENIQEFLSIENIQKSLTKQDYIEYKYKRKIDVYDDSILDTNYEWCLTSFTIGERKNGVPITAIMAIRSIDSIVKSQEQQKQLLDESLQKAEIANNVKNDFLANMSHDIRTPLNAILGMTAIADINIDNPAKIKDCLEKISISGNHLLNLVNEVLDMSKFEQGEIILNEEKINLVEIIEKLADMFHSNIKIKNLHLDIQIADDFNEMVIGDSVRLQQIFVNILGNAIKYTPNGGYIFIRAKQKSSYLDGYINYEITFTDTGIGMDKEFVNHIFEPFAREKSSRFGDTEGTGLGMPIAKHLAELMKGEIRIKTEQGKGSSFTVSINLKVAKINKINYNKFKDLSILISNKNKGDLDTLSAILTESKIKTDIAFNENEVFDKAINAHNKKDDYSAIILDFDVNKESDLQLINRLRKEIGSFIPIIAIVDDKLKDCDQQKLSKKINKFITEPILKSKIIKMLDEVFALRNKISYIVEDNKRKVSENYKNKKVLIVEDNIFNMEILEDILLSIGMQSEKALNGKNAVEKVLSNPEGYYDLIFMDIQMPIMDGYETTKVIRSSERKDLKEIPIIAITADIFTSDIKKVKEYGMNEYISKPINIPKLLEVLNRFI